MPQAWRSVLRHARPRRGSLGRRDGFQEEVLVKPGASSSSPTSTRTFTATHVGEDAPRQELDDAKRQADRHAAPVLRRSQPRAADRAAGHRRRRQGRHLLACDQRHGPAGRQGQGFKQPTPEEHAHDFLWRVHPHAPAKGEVAVFNRSHYEDVLVVRVHKLVPKPVWQARYDSSTNGRSSCTPTTTRRSSNSFSTSRKDEQLARFKERLDDPARQWKISASDYKERDYWDDYIEAFEDALTNARRSTRHGT